MVLLDSLVGWSRAQFALTAAYHWLFVPLTLGLGLIMCILETIYVRTGKEEWKQATKFWMNVFGINFAIGVATGLILEFEFGTNWSNYSWLVGDIFGAPLAIEGILAFFMEATFISLMFFGWKKLSKGGHLAATWLTVVGATISALWILVANAWMQHPTGTAFNIDTVRSEMIDFWAVISPFALNKFFHTVISSWVLGSVFVLGVSCWFLLKNRHTAFALRSIKVAAVVGICAMVLTIWTGHGSAQQVAQHQPMKLAAMEGLYEGQGNAPLVGFGLLNPAKTYDNAEDAFLFKIDVPFSGFLSWIAYYDSKAYIPGIKDVIDGGYTPYGKDTPEIAFAEKKERGKAALAAMQAYTNAQSAKGEKHECVKAEKSECEGELAKSSVAETTDSAKSCCAASEKVCPKSLKATFDENSQYFGYSYIETPEDLIPNVPLVFYSFHVMVYLGCLFLLLFVLALWFLRKDKIVKMKWFHWVSILCIPLAYLCSQLGWVVAEVGRQPWAIQEILPVNAAVSKLSEGAVQVTFFLFLALFTALLVAEITIMVKQIKKGVTEK
ncbi:cytochrome d ubiquinol oxidase subunit I [Bacteroidia bacterium]|nr:cytochrome d ubiquinol oxidase subunit I [Bacteroidia bacterium]GHV45380.1 cytochrome d ubiquinol oxidase subunit I [Bacteroidia bacterium]